MKIWRFAPLVASVALLSACQDLYKFTSANLRAVGAQPLVILARPQSKTETAPVTATDTLLPTLASGIKDAINGSPDFRAAGISADVPKTAPATVALTYPATADIVWSGTATTNGGKATAGEQFQFTSSTAGVATLALSGTVAAGDQIKVTASTNLKDSIAAVVNQSQHACSDFVSGLVLAETASNTSFDILSTITSALATVFHPLSTVHSLTAGTTILTGSKTAVDSDIYAKASVANFATAIQSTYYTDMGKYVNGLGAADPTTLDWQIEMYKISVIHAECALAPAEASIAATLQPSQPASPQAPALTVTATATDTTLNSLATNLSSQINASQAFNKAGLSAGTPTAAGSNITLALSYPSGTSINWSASAKTAAGTNAGEQISFATTTTGATITLSGSVAKGDVVTILGTPSPSAGSTAPSAAAPAQGLTPAATTPPAVTPGHSIK
jgi:hypothetical protein